jgi:hypothetical protein
LQESHLWRGKREISEELLQAIDVIKDRHVLGLNTMQLYQSSPTFRSKALPTSSGSESNPSK